MMDSLLQAFRDHRGKSSWGRVAGSVILLNILAVWSVLSLRRGEWIEFDPFTAAIVVGVYVSQAFKSVSEPSPGNPPQS